MSGPLVFLVFVVIPAAIYALIAALSMGRKPGKPDRYHSGQPWNYEPVWWSGNPQGAEHEPAQADSGTADSESAAAQTAFGGARGGW